VCNIEDLVGLNDCLSISYQLPEQRWRAFLIHIIGSATQFPNVVFHLANNLSRNGISILHISTFENEIFLVQESDVDRATLVLEETSVPEYGVEPNFTQINYNNDNSTASTSGLQEDESTSQMSDSNKFKLCVLPGYVNLCKLSNISRFSECSDILV